MYNLDEVCAPHELHEELGRFMHFIDHVKLKRTMTSMRILATRYITYIFGYQDLYSMCCLSA